MKNPPDIRRIDGLTVEFRYSPRRKSAALLIDAGRPVILLPAGTPDGVGESLCRRFRTRIGELLQRHAACGIYPPPEYRIGGIFRWLGEAYPIVSGEPDGFDGECFRSHSTDPAVIARNMERGWRQMALRMLTDKTFDLAERNGIAVASVRIGSAQTRWGSCTSEGHIRYSWRLGLCPEPLVDYVVAHEVAHRRHMDHSPAFWREVAALCPDAARKRRDFQKEAMRLSAWKGTK
ncbi:MAG: M48 family metallopeptidase [Lentisphaeria bacterium]|nr:M48 family metallopeptidase [Lentisphaeria bacterium]